MRVLPYLIALCLTLVLLSAPASAATPGLFLGTIVEEGHPEAAETGWIYVQGRNGGIRKVDISHASITYGDDVPARSRDSQPRGALVSGTEVRVTAEQGSDGEWRATLVEILKRPKSQKIGKL
jgi:hypothetical protein